MCVTQLCGVEQVEVFKNVMRLCGMCKPAAPRLQICLKALKQTSGAFCDAEGTALSLWCKINASLALHDHTLGLAGGYQAAGENFKE